MKSICEMIDGGEKGERTYTVQISEGGRVTLSFDGSESNTSVWITVRELQELNIVIANALSQRQKQLREELA